MIVDERGVATITIDHPPVNLMSVEVLIELLQTGEQLAADDAVRVVVLGGQPAVGRRLGARRGGPLAVGGRRAPR